MNTKLWLNRARVLAAEIDKMLVEGSDTEAAFAEWIITKMEIVNAVYKLTDRRERVVLIDYFCNRLTVREIAENLGLTITHTFRIKADAIRHMGEVLGFE